jgi:SAM-dependent methyltransferase
MEPMRHLIDSLRRTLRKQPAPNEVPPPAVVAGEPPGVGEEPPEETFCFRGFDIPVRLMLLTGGGPGGFESISDLHLRNLDREHGVRPGLRVLELGCGIGRDAIPLAERIGTDGSYLGIDIIRDSIEWCHQNITQKYPNVRFHFDDVRDTLHNPDGTEDFASIRLPMPDASVDLIVAQSVFTHMLRPAATHYFREFRRVLAPGGTVYATCFRVNPEILEVARRTNLTPWDLRFEHEIGEGCFVNELEHLTGAVAFTEPVIEAMLAEAGLRLRGAIRPGAWSGHFAECFDGQDALVLGGA